MTAQRLAITLPYCYLRLQSSHPLNKSSTFPSETPHNVTQTDSSAVAHMATVTIFIMTGFTGQSSLVFTFEIFTITSKLA